MSKPKKLKRVVIKEELVTLTGDYVAALIEAPDLRVWVM